MWQCGMYDTVQISIQKKKKEGKKKKYLKEKKRKSLFSEKRLNITRPNVVSRSEDEIVYVTSVGKEFKARESFPTLRLRLLQTILIDYVCGI